MSDIASRIDELLEGTRTMIYTLRHASAQEHEVDRIMSDAADLLEGFANYFQEYKEKFLDG